MSKSLKKAMILIGIFYTMMFGAIGYTLNKAFSEHQDVMDTEYYSKGLDYQAIIDRRAKAKKAGWSLKGLPQDNSHFKAGVPIPLEVIIKGNDGKNVNQAQLKIVLDKRAGGGRLKDIIISPNEKGILKGQFILPEAGYWEVYIFADLKDAGEIVERRMLSAGT